MPVTEGEFVWYELMTADAPAAETFYTKVVGWNAVDAGMPGPTYTLLKVGERPVAGVMEAPPAAAIPPGWIAHILTPDVDATAERAQAAGATLHRPPADIPGVGRFAVLADPQGAAFMLFRADGIPAPDLPPTTPGAIGWHELHARDHEAALAFYQGLFGWKKADAVDMGDMGTYQTFTMPGAGQGGGMLNDPRATQPFWLYYINVEDIDAAASRVTEAGGTVQMAPQQVPGGSWIVHGKDPTGALFALLGPRA
jgi:predicted enzyme related to lactoylglutathione lyase